MTTKEHVELHNKFAQEVETMSKEEQKCLFHYQKDNIQVEYIRDMELQRMAWVAGHNEMAMFQVAPNVFMSVRNPHIKELDPTGDSQAKGYALRCKLQAAESLGYIKIDDSISELIWDIVARRIDFSYDDIWPTVVKLLTDNGIEVNQRVIQNIETKLNKPILT